MTPEELDQIAETEREAQSQFTQRVNVCVAAGCLSCQSQSVKDALDQDVGRLALEWGRQNLQPRFRGNEGSGKVFGPEVSVPQDAPLYDRLAGFFGRDPR